MVGDPGRLRAEAAQARLVADRVRLSAVRVRALGAVRWRSPAATVYRERVEEHAMRLERLAAAVLAAADAVDRHATAAEEAAEATAEVARHLLDAAQAAATAPGRVLP